MEHMIGGNAQNIALSTETAEVDLPDCSIFSYASNFGRMTFWQNKGTRHGGIVYVTQRGKHVVFQSNGAAVSAAADNLGRGASALTFQECFTIKLLLGARLDHGG
jgi:hypothetical protein